MSEDRGWYCPGCKCYHAPGVKVCKCKKEGEGCKACGCGTNTNEDTKDTRQLLNE